MAETCTEFPERPQLGRINFMLDAYTLRTNHKSRPLIIMTTETDYQLSEPQWETLRALRPSSAPLGRLNRYVLDQMVVMGLVAMSGETPVLTPAGRAAVLRGCPRLWDLAA